mmetsp:Transcript_7851/g.13462  ORF Transcript_7851/g.13462 Transcript_7851/m.13462 type:complete len:216 (-) Transcript_7851:1117-1764(-)
MLTIWPLRRLRKSTTVPVYSLGTSTWASSHGSYMWPSISLRITFGAVTANSKPSLLMVSIRMPRWRGPRPLTRNLSAESVSSTRSETFFSSSLYSRSRRFLLVTYLPSRPANGLVFTQNSMRTVGSWTLRGMSGLTLSLSQTVSPIDTSSRPVTATMSPAEASVTGTLPKFSKTNMSEILAFRGVVSGMAMTMSWPLRRTPERILPMAMRPLCSS